VTEFIKAGSFGGGVVGWRAGGRGCNVIMAYVIEIVANHATPVSFPCYLGLPRCASVHLTFKAKGWLLSI